MQKIVLHLEQLNSFVDVATGFFALLRGRKKKKPRNSPIKILTK